MLTDHVAILLYSSLDQARVSKLKPQRGPVYFAQFAFPPTAGPDLQALAQSVAPGGNLQGLEIGGFSIAGQLKKPIPGIPLDWLTVRTESQFAPTLVDQHGQPLVGGDAIRAVFYAGRRVRAALSSFPWVHDKTGRKGVSFNLQGVMDAGPGERLAIGEGVVANEFQRYATGGGAGATQGAGGTPNPFAIVAAPSPALTPSAGGSNPFVAQGPGVQAPNPFGNGAGGAPASANNPFVQ
jgi:hypothetical protein